jgi:hypothetical protein
LEWADTWRFFAAHAGEGHFDTADAGEDFAADVDEATALTI